MGVRRWSTACHRPHPLPSQNTSPIFGTHGPLGRVKSQSALGPRILPDFVHFPTTTSSRAETIRRLCGGRKARVARFAVWQFVHVMGRAESCRNPHEHFHTKRERKIGTAAVDGCEEGPENVDFGAVVPTFKPRGRDRCDVEAHRPRNLDQMPPRAMSGNLAGLS